MIPAMTTTTTIAMTIATTITVIAETTPCSQHYNKLHSFSLVQSMARHEHALEMRSKTGSRCEEVRQHAGLLLMMA